MLLSHHGRTPKIPVSCFIEESARIIGDVILGEQSSIWFNVVIRGDVNYIHVGHRTNVQDGAVIHVSQKYPAEIGDEVTIGHNATLHGCTVSDGCLIGMGAVLLDGVRIGEESMIAAGSVVVPGTEVPPRSFMVGTPARLRRLLTESEVHSLRVSAANYVEHMREYR